MLIAPIPRRSLANAGVTLIELMIVIAIVGILAAFSLPMLQDLVVSGQVRSAAMDIYASMTFARSEAIKRNTTVTITPAGDWKNGWSIAADGVADILAAHDPLPANLDSLGGAAVTYTRDGRLTSGADIALSVVVSGNANVSMRCITVRASGQPNIRIDTNRDGNCNNG